MKKQSGYINLDGFFVGIIVAGVVIGIAVSIVVPWLWSVVKPIIHAMTGG